MWVAPHHICFFYYCRWINFKKVSKDSSFKLHAANVAERAIDSVEELEDYLNISTEALTNDTSSWTEADWASQWTGDPATHRNVNGERIELTAEEQQKIHAEWAKNRAEQYGN